MCSSFCLFEAEDQLPTESFPAHGSECTVPQRIAQGVSTSSVEREAEAFGETPRPPGTSGIVMEAPRMQYAQSTCRQIIEAAAEIDDPLRLVRLMRIQATDERVDSKIAPSHVLFETAWMHVRQSARLGVALVA